MPQTVGSTMVWMPLAYRASSFAMASATRASSSHQSLPWFCTCSVESTKTCSCIRVGPRWLSSTGPRTLSTTAMGILSGDDAVRPECLRGLSACQRAGAGRYGQYDLRMPALPRRADRRGDHLIVCGDGPLSYRIAEELTSRYGERVTVILPSRRRNHGPQISALPQVRVLEHPELSSQAFTDADVQSARALAVVWQDDVGNLHAGVRAQELNPGLRLVLALFNRPLGEHIRMLFPDCMVLSGTAMAAPSFVAAALGEPAPSHVRGQRRTLYVARPDDVAPGAVVCGL